MERQQSIPCDELVANLSWVQRLALSIARNPDAADDLTQEVARVWLERRPDLAEPSRGLRAWLAAVTRRVALDRVRSEAARRAREHCVSRPELVSDTYDVVERGAWQKRVSESVMDLSEPYRSTILYCYLDQLPTRVVAQRMGVQEATVRKRLERGLAMLRVRLGGSANDGSQRWLAGLLIMSTKTKLAVAALAVGLALLIALRTTLFSSAVERVNAGTAPVLVQEAEDSAPVDKTAVVESGKSSPARVPVERDSVIAAAAPTTGSLLVHIVWGDDKTPAAGVLVSLERSGTDPLFDKPMFTSDDEGTVRFADVKPGKVNAQVNRGGMGNWSDSVVITAGAQSECSIEVEIGMDCKGIVVDGSEKPIADAEVLVADWGGQEALTMTRAAADGTFAMRSVATHCHIGARAPGFACSPLRQFTAGKGAQVELHIVLAKASAPLTGVVLGPEGQPLAGTVVQAGSSEQGNEKLPDGTMVMQPRPERVRTDVEGRFEFRSLAPGKIPLAARALGLSPWKQSIELQLDRTNSITIRLGKGVTVIGSVRDASGAKVAKAEISLGEWDELDHRSAGSDADGSFRIEGAAAGTLKLKVEREGQGKAEAALEALAGETVRWDPVLSNGLTLHGLVLDQDGKPVKSVMLEASLEHGTRDLSWFAFESSDDAGRFTLKNCLADQPIRISARRKSMFPELVLRRVIPGADELVIHLPKEGSIWIQGKILDPDGAALPSVHASPSMSGAGSSPAESADPKSGEFKYGPYPPGEYQLRLQADGYPEIRLPKRVLAADEVWDVGTLKFEKGGTLLVNLLTANAQPPDQIRFMLLDASGTYVEQIDVKGGVGHSTLLAPGSYLLQVSDRRFASVMQAFDVRGGVETKLDVQLQPGVSVEIQWALPESEPGDVNVQIVITDRSGTVVLRSTAGVEAGALKFPVCLLPGEYRIEASTDASHAIAALTLAAGSAAVSVPLELTRK